MGLKSPRLSLLFDVGMEHGDLFRDPLAMVLKTDHPAQPNGSPLLSPPIKNNDVFANNGNGSGNGRAMPPQLQPLRVDVNGCRQFSMLSPLDGQPSSLVSSALPTPLLEMESNSNCSDSAVPHGDLYPAIFTGGASMTFKPTTDLRSPPGTLPPGAFAFSTQNYKPSPAKSAPSPLVKRSAEPNKTRALADKVARHKADLKFMIPRASGANHSHLTSMLKKARKLAELPRVVDAYLFEDEVVEPLRKTVKKEERVICEDMTDYSDLEEAEEISVPYNLIRADEERARFSCVNARVAFIIQEKKRLRDQLAINLESSISQEEPLLETSPSHGCARERPYIRRCPRKLLRFNRPVDYEAMQPSTSGSGQLPLGESPDRTIANVVHFASMVPSLHTRRSLNHPVHSIDGQDLQEECVRNGWNRRAEKEKRRLRAEAIAAGKERDSSDYEDTDPDSGSEYNPKSAPPKKEVKKKGRGRPPKDKTADYSGAAALAKAGRRQSQLLKQPIYDYYDGVIEFASTNLVGKPRYQEIVVPGDLVVDEEVAHCKPGQCHRFEDLKTELMLQHQILEEEERAHFKTKAIRRAAAPKRETSMDESCWADSPGSKASPSCRLPA